MAEAAFPGAETPGKASNKVGVTDREGQQVVNIATKWPPIHWYVHPQPPVFGSVSVPFVGEIVTVPVNVFVLMWPVYDPFVPATAAILTKLDTATFFAGSVENLPTIVMEHVPAAAPLLPAKIAVKVLVRAAFWAAPEQSFAVQPELAASATDAAKPPAAKTPARAMAPRTFFIEPMFMPPSENSSKTGGCIVVRPSSALAKQATGKKSRNRGTATP
jgi:hypothetical protein